MSALDRMSNFTSNAARYTPRRVEIPREFAEKYDLSRPENVFLAKLDMQGFSMTELGSVLQCDTDQLTISGAGSGKSTALIFKIMYGLISGQTLCEKGLPDGTKVSVPDKIWVSTFLHSGADELRQKLAKMQYKFGYPVSSDSIEFSTMHAEFKRALNAMGVQTIMCPQDYKDSRSSSALLRKAIHSLGILPNDREKLSEDDYQLIGGMVTNYRNRLDDTRYADEQALDYGLTPMVFDALVETFRRNRQEAGVMDFEDLQELLYRFLYTTPNKNVQDFIANRYKYIYLDEFQDTSQIQYAILKFYARGRLIYNRDSLGKYNKEVGGELSEGLYKPFESEGGKIFAVGDDDQCIYGWRGSDIRIILNRFEADFYPTVSNLTVNYRCPSNILNPVIPSIERNELRHRKSLVSSAEGGDCVMYLGNNNFEMLKDMYDRIEEDVAKGMSVAIICRTNYEGVLPALMLEMKHKYTFSISGANMGLGTALPRKLLSMASLFTERSSYSVQNALSMFVYRNINWKVKNMVQAMKNDNSSIWTINLQDVAYSCPEILSILKQLRSFVLDDDGKRVPENEVYALKWVYSWLYENYYKGDSVFCTSARSYLSMLIFILDEMHFKSIFEFQDMMEMYGDGLRAKIKKQDTQISIVTVHEFKGKERDSVYIWHDSDGTFPTQKCDLSNQSQLEEERRVHYIACTRARKKLTIYAQTSAMGMFARELTCKKIELKKKVVGTLGSNTQTNELDWEGWS